MNDFLVFKIEHGDLRLMAKGSIWASGPHHMLIQHPSTPTTETPCGA